MNWVAPQAGRTDPPYVADERARLDGWYHRATLLRKCAGLTGEQLAQRPVPTSALSLLGLVRHMAGNERIWFRIRFAGADLDDLYWSPRHPEGEDFELADPAAAASDFATYTAEVEAARRVVSGRPLDEIFGDETHTVDLRWLYAHMIEEYARHKRSRGPDPRASRRSHRRIGHAVRVGLPSGASGSMRNHPADDHF